MAAPPDSEVVQCAVLARVPHLGNQSYDYLVPPGLRGRVAVGSVAVVPFGRRKTRAVVTALGASGYAQDELKAILALEPDSVPDELLELARLVADRYLASFESCLRLVVPPRKAGKIAAESGRGRDWVTRTGLSPEDAGLTPKQAKALALVPESGVRASELLAAAGVGVTVLRALEKKGVVTRGPAPPAAAGNDHEETSASGRSAEGERTALSKAGDDASAGATCGTRGNAALSLWPEQTAAIARLTDALGAGSYSRHVLWGVTGSGKTEIYLRLIARVLEEQGGAILLVPEIALTPQTVERVRSRFGSKVALFHSGLAPGERLREYRRVRYGEAPIVVGARSAVFAPVPNLKLIVIDEAHDSSYKQEEEPRYEVRTVAELRLRAKGGLLLEGSATPSVESLARAGGVSRLTRRAAGSLPELEVVDMRRQGGGHLLAPCAREALAEVLRRAEQAIILLNRRGYAGYVHCELCGHVMTCSACELSVTYHGRGRRLICHHCGRSFPQPALCPVCGEAPLSRGAPGTERLDEELRQFVPQQKVFRMDSDVAGNSRQVQRILAAFAQCRPAVLVGTQMVAKGHDFPDVTLVVVADADVGLWIPDFRAAERTFQLLTQVAGRAGRAERPGRVLVQTWNPEVPCIRMALERDESGFYREELATRRRLGYPPFTEMLRLLTISHDAEKARAGAHLLTERLGAYFVPGEVRGPVRLPVLRSRERWQLVVASEDGARARAIVGRASAQLKEPYRQRGVTLIVDVDPQAFN